MVTPTPLHKEPTLRNSIPPAEWQARVDLAAAYRHAQYAGWNDSIFNHITLRVPGEPDHFLIKPHELLFEEVTASSLLKLDMEGRPIGEDKPINPAATTIHTAVLMARPDINAVMHVHTEPGIAISAVKGGLKYFCQDAMNFYNRIGYHDFEGIATDSDECARLARDLGQGNHSVILRNHGLLDDRRQYQPRRHDHGDADPRRRCAAPPDGGRRRHHRAQARGLRAHGPAVRQAAQQRRSGRMGRDPTQPRPARPVVPELGPSPLSFVMPGLVPGIHVLQQTRGWPGQARP